MKSNTNKIIRRSSTAICIFFIVLGIISAILIAYTFISTNAKADAYQNQLHHVYGVSDGMTYCNHAYISWEQGRDYWSGALTVKRYSLNSDNIYLPGCPLIDEITYDNYQKGGDFQIPSGEAWDFILTLNGKNGEQEIYNTMYVGQ